MVAEVRNMTCKLASLLLVLVVMFTIAAPATAGDPVNKEDIAAIRAANPWLAPAAKHDMTITLQGFGDKPTTVTQKLVQSPTLGLTFNPASLTLLAEDSKYQLEWGELGKPYQLVYRAQGEDRANAEYGNGPIDGHSYRGYFHYANTRWDAVLDKHNRIAEEHIYATLKNRPEKLIGGFVYRYDDAFSANYPASAIVTCEKMRFDVEFQMVMGQWVVKQSDYTYDGRLRSTLTVRLNTK